MTNVQRTSAEKTCSVSRLSPREGQASVSAPTEVIQGEKKQRTDETVMDRQDTTHKVS